VGVADGLVVRRAVAADRPAILGLLAASLGRDASDRRYESLFTWKHEESPFGASPVWVAVDGERLAGVRAMMRWEFEVGGRAVRAVRAVDTATNPEDQGRGVFTKLTLHAVDELREEGVEFVFNTPNDQSRRGYLKMGWQVVGRLPAAVRPTRLRALPRIARARVPAERWSAPTRVGEPASAVLDRAGELGALLASQPASAGVRTRRSVEFLRWRYGSELLGYRAVTAAGEPADGVAFVRVRERGPARELVLADLLVPSASRRAEALLVRRLAREADADYVIRLGGGPLPAGPMVPFPGQGPLLVWRAVREPLVPRDWELSLGDIELF
jgi:GNAT superfamily N-acetyltransferase